MEPPEHKTGYDKKKPVRLIASDYYYRRGVAAVAPATQRNNHTTYKRRMKQKQKLGNGQRLSFTYMYLL